MTLTHRKSVVIAFHKLLKAARDGAEVLLLDQRDGAANLAVQEYNDHIADESDDPEYARFTDQLAEIFDRQVSQGTGKPKMPSDAQLISADQVLGSILK